MLRIISAAAATIVLVNCAYAAESTSEQADLKVEGLFASADAPGGWSVIMNGKVASAGQTVDGYEILSVDSQGARIKELQTGVIESVQPGAEKERTIPEPPSPAPKAGVDGFLEKNFPALVNYKEQFVYGGIVKDLKKVHVEAMQYIIDEAKSVSVSQLVSIGRLPPSFRHSTSHGYRLTIQSVQGRAGGARVSAEPLDKKETKRYFLMDEHGYLTSEIGRPATQRSPRFSSGYNITVTPG